MQGEFKSLYSALDAWLVHMYLISSGLTPTYTFRYNIADLTRDHVGLNEFAAMLLCISSGTCQFHIASDQLSTVVSNSGYVSSLLSYTTEQS